MEKQRTGDGRERSIIVPDPAQCRSLSPCSLAPAIGLRALGQQVVQEVLEAEMDETVGARKGERTESRVGYRSGCKKEGESPPANPRRLRSRAAAPEARSYFFSAAFFAAHRFFCAAMMLALPSALNTRFFAGFALRAFGSAAAFTAAHLLRCASAIAFLPAALIFRRGCFAIADVDAAGEAERIARRSEICSSSLRFCASKPSIAASIISLVSLKGIHSHLARPGPTKILTSSIFPSPFFRCDKSRP